MKKRILSLVALPGFFKGDFYEVSVDYIKTLFLGVRRSVVRVLALVVLLACCVSPAYAEFGSTDSNNLSSIRTNVQNIWNRINTNLNYPLQSIASLISTTNTVLSGINTNLLNSIGWNLGHIGDKQDALYDLTNDIYSKIQSIESKIDTLIQNQETQIQNQETQISNQETQIQNQQTQIGNQETQIQNQETQIENENQIIDNQDRLYDYLYSADSFFVDSSFFIDSDNYVSFTYLSLDGSWNSLSYESNKMPYIPQDLNFSSLVFFSRPSEKYVVPLLRQGIQYQLVFVIPSSSIESFSSLKISGYTYTGETYFSSLNSSLGVFSTCTFYFTPTRSIPLNNVELYFSSPIKSSGGYVQVIFSPVSDQQFLDDSFGGSVNSGQSQITNDVQSSVGQLDDFDNEIFQNVADYTAKLDFGLSSWGEAAAGIAYIGSIFLMIWNNSPTQVVVLSLMIGLCILLLGRGARVAGAVRRSHRDDDGGGG